MSKARTVYMTVEAPFVHSTGPALSRFFTALRDDGVIWGRRCEPCGRVCVPPGEHCDTCGAQLGEWIRVGPSGIVQGRTVVTTPEPAVFVRVLLDGADTELIHRGNDASIDVGDRVYPVWAVERVGSIRDIEHFATDSAPDHPGASPDSDPVTIVRDHMRLPFGLSAGALQSNFQTCIQRGEIRGNRCASCDTVYVPPRSFCARCWTECHDSIQVRDQGTISTFVVVNVPFYGQEIEIPYVLANIVLDGAGVDLLHLVGTVNESGRLTAPGRALRIGDRVRAVWCDGAERSGFINDDIQYFELIGGDADGD